MFAGKLWGGNIKIEEAVNKGKDILECFETFCELRKTR